MKSISDGKPFRSTASALALLLTAGAFAGCGDDAEESTTPASGDTGTATGETAPAGDARPSADVQVVDFDYDPDPVTVEAGGSVTWENEDTASHTASSDDGAPSEFDTGTLEEGDSKKVTLDEPGTYAYHCDFHATMTAAVEVVE